MKPIEIIHGRHRLYFDPSTGCLRMTFDGKGLIDTFSEEERIKLSKVFWYSAKN